MPSSPWSWRSSNSRRRPAVPIGCLSGQSAGSRAASLDFLPAGMARQPRRPCSGATIAAACMPGSPATTRAALATRPAVAATSTVALLERAAAPVTPGRQPSKPSLPRTGPRLATAAAVPSLSPTPDSRWLSWTRAGSTEGRTHPQCMMQRATTSSTRAPTPIWLLWLPSVTPVASKWAGR